eukprot:gene13100-14441_t
MAAAGFRNDAWKNDFVLKEQLLDYVKQNMKRYVSIEEIKTVVAEELEGPGKILGYRAMNKQIRQKHGILAPRDVVHDVIRKMLWLLAWTTHSDPMVLHNKLNTNIDPADSVIYGPSTSNQIERWWRELPEKLELYFKDHLQWLKDQEHFDPIDERHRFKLIFCLFLQAMLVKEEDLAEVAAHSGVLNTPIDFLELDFRALCEDVLPFNQIEAKDIKEAFLFLKQAVPL